MVNENLEARIGSRTIKPVKQYHLHREDPMRYHYKQCAHLIAYIEIYKQHERELENGKHSR